ncbi:MAG: WG repeat-containing protein, partial [Muribaculaceae bacterium]|nr:WG repeat-containing protein [Muribaculaceae bacterium]
FEYEAAGVWVSDRGKVKTSKGYGMINSDGNIFINPQWEDIYVTVEPFDHLWMKSKKDGMWYAVNLATDKVVTTSPVKDLEAQHLAGDKAYVKDGEKHGMVALNGEVIIPLEFENSGTVERAYKYIRGLGKNRMGTTDKHRFLLYSNPNTSNKLADKVPSEQWDY